MWDVVVPQAALSWQRVLVANWLSSSGADWAQWIQEHNSGTYNNQYIVVDLNKFSPGSELQPGLLTIVEQMPGLVMSGDLTPVSEGLMGAGVQQQAALHVWSGHAQRTALSALRTAGYCTRDALIVHLRPCLMQLALVNGCSLQDLLQPYQACVFGVCASVGRAGPGA